MTGKNMDDRTSGAVTGIDAATMAEAVKVVRESIAELKALMHELRRILEVYQSQ